MVLSHDIKESIKTALAMTIAYGIGLQMGWDRPYWAGFAVAFISLATAGQSFNKAALRMSGTVLAATAALTLIALFPQQRWLLILALTCWLGFCTYMMAGKKHQYFWFVSGFAALVIGIDGGLDASNAFTIATLRLQQTGLGILVYSLVAIFLWPNSSRVKLGETILGLVTVQHKLFDAVMQLALGAGDRANINSLSADENAGNTRLATLLDAAASDSEEVRERLSDWRNVQRASAELAETTRSWRENFGDLQSLPLHRLLPGLDDYEPELERRFISIKSMLGNEAAQQPCTGINLDIDDAAFQALSHFHRASLLVTRRQLLRIEELTRILFNSSSSIGGFTESSRGTEPQKGKPTHRTLDPERLLAAGKMMLISWLAFLAVIYIGDFPGGFGFISMCGSIGMQQVTAPQMRVRQLMAPVAIGIGFAAGLYIFVMPQLTSFIGLGLMIFLATFLICYRYASPQKGLNRSIGLAMFVVTISVSDQQSYDFLSVTTNVLMFSLLFLLLAFVAHIPYSPRPERALLRLLTRYFRGAEFLLSQADKPGKGALLSWRESFHRHELASLPGKIKAWIAHADPAVLGAESVQQLPVLGDCLQTLTSSMQELLEVRNLPQSPLLLHALSKIMRAWRHQVIDVFQYLPADPTHKEALLISHLNKRLVQMERQVEIHLDEIAGADLSSAEQESIYLLLGAYRGVSHALLDFAKVADDVDWVPWYEERFA
jgi:uncharacterized membrane protein YccC